MNVAYTVSGSPCPEPRTAVRHPLATLVAALALAMALAAAPSALWAQGSGGGDDLLQGFDSGLPGDGGGDSGQDGGDGQGDNLLQGFDSGLPGGGSAQPGTQPEPKPQWWHWGGFLRLDSAYAYAHEAPPPGRTDWRGLTKLRLTLRLELSAELGGSWQTFVSGQAFRDAAYAINGRDEYTSQVLDAYEQEAEVREAWVQGTVLPAVDLKVGRQIVVWGRSDQLRVTDVLNPVDNREPGLTDLEDVRLPVTMTKVDTYFGDWDWSLIAVHEQRFNKDPAVGSDYLPAAYAALPPVREPDSSGANTDYATALEGIFSGWDISFYAARLYAEETHVADVAPGPPVALKRVHSRVTMLGAASSVALGNWLLKGELARFDGLEYFNVPGRDFARIEGLVGTEYAGFANTTLTFEALGRRMLDYDERLAAPPDLQKDRVNQYLASYRADLWHDTLELAAIVSAFGSHFQRGTLQRYQGTYELVPALNLTLGVVTYNGGSEPNFLLETAKDNDRLFAQLKWDF